MPSVQWHLTAQEVLKQRASHESWHNKLQPFPTTLVYVCMKVVLSEPGVLPSQETHESNCSLTQGPTKRRSTAELCASICRNWHCTATGGKVSVVEDLAKTRRNNTGTRAPASAMMETIKNNATLRSLELMALSKENDLHGTSEQPPGGLLCVSLWTRPLSRRDDSHLNFAIAARLC